MKTIIISYLILIGILSLSGCSTKINCPEVELKAPIDAWNKQIPQEQLKSNIDYGDWKYITIALNQFDITSVLACRVGSKAGQNVNYCYTDKLIKIRNVDTLGNIAEERRIGLIFNQENNLIGSYCD